MQYSNKNLELDYKKIDPPDYSFIISHCIVRLSSAREVSGTDINAYIPFVRNEGFTAHVLSTSCENKIISMIRLCVRVDY